MIRMICSNKLQSNNDVIIIFMKGMIKISENIAILIITVVGVITIISVGVLFMKIMIATSKDTKNHKNE